jgi:hypothetical protein
MEYEFTSSNIPVKMKNIKIVAIDALDIKYLINRFMRSNSSTRGPPKSKRHNGKTTTKYSNYLIHIRNNKECDNYLTRNTSIHDRDTHLSDLPDTTRHYNHYYRQHTQSFDASYIHIYIP